MELNSNIIKPIFMQVANWVEDEILRGNIKQDQQVLSQLDLAKAFNISPITAAKGINILENRGVVYKKRGLGMFTSPNACRIIQDYRKNENLYILISDIAIEAQKLQIDKDTLINMLIKEIDKL